MKRFVPLVAAVAALAVVGGAVALALTADGPKAFSIGDRTVSQRSVDDELRVLGENPALRDAVAQQSGATPLSTHPGSVTSTVSAGWVGLLISQEVAAATVQRAGVHITAADRARGTQLATESVGGSTIFDTMPDWFRERIAARWAAVAALERRLVANPTNALDEGVAAACPSGRYVAHIQVATEAEAVSAKGQLDAGAAFGDVAASTSTDTGSANAGGALGCADGQDFPTAFATVATSQAIGVVSDPVQTDFGFHLILVTDEASAADYERLALEVVLSGSRGAAVDLDPRYGVWDRRVGQVVPQPVRGAVTSPPVSATG